MKFLECFSFFYLSEGSSTCLVLFRIIWNSLTDKRRHFQTRSNRHSGVNKLTLTYITQIMWLQSVCAAHYVTFIAFWGRRCVWLTPSRFPPGSPSGHAMGAAGVWYVMVTALLATATEKRCPPLLYRWVCDNTSIISVPSLPPSESN